MKYTKKQIKEALKNYGVKGYSRAFITSANWVIVGDYCGKINNEGMLYLEPMNKNDFTSKRYTIYLSVNGCRRTKTPTETHEKGIFSGLFEKIG